MDNDDDIEIYDREGNHIGYGVKNSLGGYDILNDRNELIGDSDPAGIGGSHEIYDYKGNHRGYIDDPNQGHTSFHSTGNSSYRTHHYRNNSDIDSDQEYTSFHSTGNSSNRTQHYSISNQSINTKKSSENREIERKEEKEELKKVLILFTGKTFSLLLIFIAFLFRWDNVIKKIFLYLGGIPFFVLLIITLLMMENWRLPSRLRDGIYCLFFYFDGLLFTLFLMIIPWVSGWNYIIGCIFLFFGIPFFIMFLVVCGLSIKELLDYARQR